MFAIVSLILLALGCLAMFGGGIWGIVLSFQESTTWGLLYFFVPFAALVFVIKKWSKKSVRRSFFLSLGGFIAVILSAVIPAVLFGSASPNFATDSATIYEETDLAFEDDASLEADTAETASTTESSSTSDSAASTANAAPTDSTASNQTSIAQSETQAPCNFKQCMSVGYAAYGQKDYQTALINFERALQQQPNNEYAINAVNNTKAILQTQ